MSAAAVSRSRVNRVRQPRRPLRPLVCGLVFGLALATAPSASALEAGDKAPAFAAPSLTSEGNLALSQFRGKVVYLDFWASWCAPCLTAIPEIEKLRSEFGGDRFEVLAVNLDQKKKKALRFLSKTPISYPSCSDPKGRLPDQFGLDTMPTAYLIDKKGVIRYVHRGFQRGDGEKIREEIRALLREK